MPFQKATKTKARLRMALIGPSGSGKTYTALRIASALGQRVAVIDTERGSASKYASDFAFDTLELESFHPQRYIEATHEAEEAGYDVLIIDSLSHAWSGRDGALELVDRAAKRAQSGNSFGAWREVTPIHNQLVDAIVGARLHVIATMRTKTDYVQDKDDRGKTQIRKVGLAPIQRDGLEYEFDLVGDLDIDNTLIVSKSRCKALTGYVERQAGENIAAILKAWLTDGAEMPEGANVPALSAAINAHRGSIRDLVAPPDEPREPKPTNGTAIHSPYVCAECEKPIQGAHIAGADRTAEFVAIATKRKFKRSLCADCARRAQDALDERARQAAQEAALPPMADDDGPELPTPDPSDIKAMRYVE